MLYGADEPDFYKRAASYVDRIQRGAKVAELPVQEPTKYELTINLKTVKAYDVTAIIGIERRDGCDASVDRIASAAPNHGATG
jgi:putative ABC transport system substrate-binding protein